MSPIQFYSRSRVKIDRLKRLAKGDNKDYAPMLPIQLLPKFMVRLEKLRRFNKGDNRD